MPDSRVPALLVITLGFASAVLAQPPATPSQPPRPVASVNTQPRVDVAGMPRPIEMRDTLWIEDLTMLEVRDLVKAGKTTALILTGGIEENGPYLTTGKHNNVLRAMGDPTPGPWATRSSRRLFERHNRRDERDAPGPRVRSPIARRKLLCLP